MSAQRKRRKDEPTAVTFWKNNLITGEHSLTEAELVEKFKAWLPNQKSAWLEYYYGEAAVRNFLALADDGIRSTFDEINFAHLYNWLMPSLIEHMNKIEEAEREALKKNYRLMASTKKLIDFDYDQAVKTGDVKLSNGNRVTIVTYKNPEPCPIFGYYHDEDNVYRWAEWNKHGLQDDEIGSDVPSLMLEVDDIDFFPIPQFNGPASQSKSELAKVIKELERNVGQLIAKNRILTEERDGIVIGKKGCEELLKRKNNLIDEYFARIEAVSKERDGYRNDILAAEKETDRLKDEAEKHNDELGRKIKDVNDLYYVNRKLEAEVDALKAWKESQAKTWGKVNEYIYAHPGNIYAHPGNTTVGDSVAAEVLQRLQKYHESEWRELCDGLRDELRAVKAQRSELMDWKKRAIASLPNFYKALKDWEEKRPNDEQWEG